ncbi:MAG: SMC-Scp complex subunit ScpB [Candidatus Vogelbacteria bacterium]|nr:SMC-Scp complex subunit ScpB [Candidatus Vogelbacteria bacterium]
MNLDAKIESILFYKNEPVKIRSLSKILTVSEQEISQAVERLKIRLIGGIVIMTKDDEVVLSTNPEASDLIEKLIKDSLNSELGKAALDTLTIILYYGPITKAEIDNIRGVNSGFILRNLLVRGLIDRIQNDRDQRSFLYRPTFELLAYLGIKEVGELPEYDELKKTLGVRLSDLKKGETDNKESQN